MDGVEELVVMRQYICYKTKVPAVAFVATRKIGDFFLDRGITSTPSLVACKECKEVIHPSGLVWRKEDWDGNPQTPTKESLKESYGLLLHVSHANGLVCEAGLFDNFPGREEVFDV